MTTRLDINKKSDRIRHPEKVNKPDTVVLESRLG